MKRFLHFLVVFVILFSGCSGFSRRYTVAIDPSFYPANLAGQTDNVYGFTADLLVEIAKLEGIRINYVAAGTESLLNGLQRNAFDGAISPRANVAVESNIYSVSKNYFSTGPVLVLPVLSNYHELSQMQGKIVGVVDQSDAESIAQKYPKIMIYAYNSPSLVIEALKYNLVDSALLDVMDAKAFVTNLYQGSFKIASEPLGGDGLYLITMVNQHPDLIESFNRGLKKAQSKGIYQKLMTKWNL